ncbi:MAG: isoprenylcysteine carboxylmethyltransferase family protein [Candidatus Altiarchaeota archaeon]|nr:isoprenylcysteine carboxylmethyltransferase family protein [Candidatus Altiarchaeota archaeon]
MFSTIFDAIYVIFLIAGVVIRRAGTRGLKKRFDMPPLELFLFSLNSIGMFFLPLLYLITTYLDFGDYQLPEALSWLGIPAFIIALWVLWKSHVDLGRRWSPNIKIQDKHELVTDGIYKHIRHPMYASHLYWALAQLLLIQNWIAGPAMLVTITPFYLYRIPKEEAMMLEHFGKAYQDYMKKTKRLIPGIL